MKKADRKIIQDQNDSVIRQARGGKQPIAKTDSLFERARKLGLATDLPAINRAQRRRDLRVAIKKESEDV